MSARARHLVTETSRPALARHVRLTFDDLRGQWAVLAPEKVLWPDEISTDILQRCTGHATVSDIVAALAEDYDAPPEQITPDVLAFLQEWCDRLLIRCRDQQREAAA
ncbi:pyrroloquinoline quinone biosynthesis peptide chaperone PqqD [Roseibium salinum]|uniref:Pyrroloquinoline quinone biosynthesis peptide chaperone PqqD n=1 Tax=Roseibium salinum TaxID=1604349 RepID=A0ABT3R4E2_9HYPH|nr:pyrroloquinoline quinone biosynthesis peptide chaperone PqqD [Roseibium sp. DSM 29163]MCX2724006.1 pyrroloquinoline quinone biosynthesis peptide chaperone PqqD [Roseibium sp. DSM 29163]